MATRSREVSLYEHSHVPPPLRAQVIRVRNGYMGRMGTGGAITRRSLIALAAAGAASVARPRGALAQLVGAQPSSLGSLPLVTSGLQSGSGQPPIVARSVWAHGSEQPKVAPEYGAVKLAFVHHTENPDGYSAAEVPEMLRSIYVFHRYTHGWNDIGYNFVIDRFGRIFEARAGGIDEPVVGAQAGGYNAYSTGIAILGTYSTKRISAAALVALEHLLAWKLSLHGVPVEGDVSVRVTADGAVYSRYPAHALVSLPRVAGHRDADSTVCPGDALYGELPAVRRGAAALAGTPARATLSLQRATAPGTQSMLLGSLQLLDGKPLPGAPIAIQARSVTHRGETVSEATLAQTTTAADGQWSLPLLLFPGQRDATALRAVCPGAANLPAAVSDPLVLAGAVSFSAPVAPSPPAQAPPPSSPESPPPAA
jgi:hypothetical protein